MRSAFVICFLFLVSVAASQNALQDYIRQGLENNLSLHQKEAGYRQSLEMLREARGLFYPSVTVGARYTVSEGGRMIVIPVSEWIPGSDNIRFLFLRPAEHETRIRLVQPVFNSDIFFNSKIKKDLAVTEEISMDQYKRELVAEIKKAYYGVGMAESMLSMLKETRLLLLENVRVNTRLVENSKVTRDHLLRSQTELSKFEQVMVHAEKNKEISRAYFNFLLNRPLTDSVIIEPYEVAGISNEPEGGDYTGQAIANREELRNLRQYHHISELAMSMNRSTQLPNIMAIADYGFQGERYDFNKKNDYLQASLVLTWDLFKGFQNRAKIKQAMISQEKIEYQLDEATNQISLQVTNALYEVKASETARQAAVNQVSTAREGFRLLNRKYEEGQASLIEFMDARNTLTQAEENLIMSDYRLLTNIAELEKVTALDQSPKNIIP